MSSSRFFLLGALKRFAALHISHSAQQSSEAAAHLSRNALPTLTSTRREASTFSGTGIDQLWEGVSYVSNAGKKRGRGKRGTGKRRINLNLGKKMGYAKNYNYVYPGLNSPIIKGSEVLKPSKSAKRPEDEQAIVALRDSAGKMKRRKKFPLERGWSGQKLAGCSAGVPDPVNDYDFSGFDSRVLQFSLVSHMTGNKGRKQSYCAVVVVGNGKGLVGTAVSKGSVGNAALRRAKNMAAQRLQYINLRDNRTLYHNFHVQVGATHVYAAPKPEGYGIVCHRAIKTIAQCIGIEDIYCKVEGSTKNIRSITAAFLRGLVNQESYQELADSSGYHVVEMSHYTNVPKVLASPNNGKVNEEKVEHWDMERHYYGGKTKLRKGKRPKFYMSLPSYHEKKLRLYKARNQRHLQISRLARQIV